MVYRVPETTAGGISVVDRIRTATGFGMDNERWVSAAIPTVMEAAQAHDVKAVVTTVSPYGVATLGELVKQRLGIPWVLDLRDPWALDGWMSFASSIHANVELKRMRKALAGADIVIGNTLEASRTYRAMIRGDDARVRTIPNGFSERDFAAVDRITLKHEAGPNSDGRFHLVHIGTLHDPEPSPARGWRVCLRKSFRNIDMTARSGRYLFEAAALVKQQRPDVFDRLQFDLVGWVDGNHGGLAASLGIGSCVKEHGYVSHDEAIALMMAGDAVFVPLHGLPSDERALIVPGKLYEASASERFVLACVPDGDAADFIRVAGAGAVCRPDDVKDIARQLIRLVDSWSTGARLEGTKRDQLARFSRRALTGRLATVISAAIDPSRSIPLDEPRPIPGAGEGMRIQNLVFPAETLPTAA